MGSGILSTGPVTGYARLNPGRTVYASGAASRLGDSVDMALRSEVSFDWLCAGITDPVSGLITTVYSPDQAAMRFGCADPGAHVSGIGAVPAVVRRREPAVLLSSAAATEPSYGRRYREFLRLNGIGHELRAALMVGDLCFGFLILQRGEDCRPFSETDVKRVRSKLPGLAEELRTELLSAAVRGSDQNPPGVVVVGPANTMQALSSHARTLLGRTPAFRPLVPGGIPVPIGVLVERLRGPAERDGRRVLVPGSDDGGWFVVSGSRVDTADGDRHFAVSLESAGPTDLAPVILRARGLTTRESAVALQVIRGLSTVEVSQSLGISRHTVQDHLKAVFAKTGVRSRRDLAHTILRDPVRG